MDAINCKDVSFSYGRGPVIEGLNCTVAAGEFTALLGSNGAGKSTILNLICGLLVPQKGDIYVRGHSILTAPLEARRNIGIVFQQTALDLELSVLQNLYYFARLHAIKAPRARIETVLAQFALLEMRNTPVRRLSGGYKRRLEIARAMLHRPGLLLLDEPTAGLDPTSKAMIGAHVHKLCQTEGVSVFWITHLLDELQADDHIIMLTEGRICETGRLKSLGGAKALLEKYPPQRWGGS